MQLGVPVVAAASGGPLESVKDGRTGFLVDPVRVRKLALVYLLAALAFALDASDICLVTYELCVDVCIYV
jgi:glycosyltransferase involved in cell wall biosynthesis